MVLVSVTVCILLLEFGLRVYSALVFPKMMILDEKLGWRHAANVSRTFVNELGEKADVIQNAYGHRGGVHSLNKTAGFFRVLTLGDSFTEGVQVGEKEVFTAQLEQADSHLEVLNSGVGGYGTVQEYLYLASEGLKFHPDLVLLMFYENDLTDNGLSYYPGFGPRPYAKMDGNEFQIIETLDPSAYEKFTLPAPFRMSLNSYSYLYYFANSRIYQRFHAKRMLEWQKADLQVLDSGTRYKLFFGTLDKIRELLAGQKIPFVVVLIPSQQDAAKGTSEIASTIEDYCEKTSIQCQSLLDRFHKETWSGSLLYFHGDIHWTSEGHKLAAHEILNYIRSSRALAAR